MSTAIGRDHVVNLVTGNPHPFAVHFDLVVVAHHAALGRATIHQVAARALAVISFERRVEALMPFIVACPVISFLRRCAYTMKRGERTTEQRDELAAFQYRLLPNSEMSRKQSPPRRSRTYDFDSGKLRDTAVSTVVDAIVMSLHGGLSASDTIRLRAFSNRLATQQEIKVIIVASCEK